MSLDAFKDRILNDLLPDFCRDSARNYDISGFRQDFSGIQEADAANFLKAFDAGLVKAEGNMYRAPRSYAREQLFWEGAVDQVPRPISLWIEPIITIATLSRLHFDLGWPPELLGTQSSDWAFDVAAYQRDDFINEYLACEVKKTDNEFASLIQNMKYFGASPEQKFANSKEKNAYKKVAGLRARRAPIFWAVGPGGTNAAFKMFYAEDGRIDFEEVPFEALRYHQQMAEVRTVPDQTKISGKLDCGPHNVDLRFNMREALLVHQALRDKEATLRKEAWWLGQRGGQDGAVDLNRDAQEHAEAADRIFRILEGVMSTER